MSEEDKDLEESNQLSDEVIEETVQELIKVDPDIEPVLKKLDSRERSELVTSLLKRESYSGPLPHPDHLKGYAEVFPDAPKEIFNMAKTQMEHRHIMEKNSLDLKREAMGKHYSNNTLGIVLGFILAITFIIGGIALIVIDKGGYGLSLISAVIVSLVGIFVIGQKEKKVSSDNSPSDPSVEESES